MMATGEAAARRLQLIDSIFGPSTRKLLISSGLKVGWRVADIGCGVGLVSFWMAEQVGSTGSVAAVDASAAQIETAGNYSAQQGFANIVFHTANAYDTGLPRESFDLVFSRFLMCHVPEPARAISEMRSLLKVGGVLACEDYEQKSVISEPPSRCYTRLNEISNAMDTVFGVDSNIGLKLPRLFQERSSASTGKKSAFGKSRFRRHGLRSCSTGWPPPKSLMKYVQRCDALPRTRQP